MHFEVERSLRDKILQASQQERAAVIQWAYDDLFRRVPWHPALTEASGAQAGEIIRQKMKIFLPLLPKPPATVLEIGCGMGELVCGLAKEGFHGVGLDISETRMERLSRMKTGSLAFVRADATYLPFAESTFDAVISVQLFEHLHPEDAEIHLQEVCRVIKPGGRYILETPNKLAGPGDVSRFFVKGEAQGFHLKEYEITEMIHLFRRYRFPSVKVILWKSNWVSQLRAFFLEKVWSLLPKNFRRRHSMGLHNPMYVAFKG